MVGKWCGELLCSVQIVKYNGNGESLTINREGALQCTGECEDQIGMKH